MRNLGRITSALLGLLICSAAATHELKTATLRLDESVGGAVLATLLVPMAGEESPNTVVPQFDPRCRFEGDFSASREPGRVLRRWHLQCEGGLADTQLRFAGLDPRMPEALIIANFADGHTQTLALDRHDPVARLSVKDPGHGLSNYFPIGITHILLGPDHLFFVFGLMLVVIAGSGSKRHLLAAITAFTVAHSLTLGMALFGVWGLPPKPVEILIAASILLLAVELARQQQSSKATALQAATASLTFRQPWLAAFGFGLLHGFGFAGALSEVGLPEAARGWALLYFNLGVEAGQLLFVVTVWYLIKAVGIGWPMHNARSRVAVVALGSVAAYWLIDRTAIWLHASFSPYLSGGLI
ncbi:MAG: HupE/UreJ family protein [Paraperlucidibaca sp.]